MDVDLRLYALVDPAVAGGRTLADLAARIAGSATLVQLRDKHGSTRAMVEEARALRGVLEPAGVPLLINDRVDVALAAEADGVHIGQDDMAAADARLLLGRTAIIGLSIKTRCAGASRRRSNCSIMSPSAASTARPPRTTPRRRSASTACATIVQTVRARSAEFPICAIAGINAGNAAEVIGAGADGVAVISALSLAADPDKAARELRAVVDAALGGEAS